MIVSKGQEARKQKEDEPMKITITPMMLCDLLGGKFTCEACEALCELYSEEYPEVAPAIGDIACSYSEINADWLEEDDEEKVIARLENGNVLIAL